MSKEWTLVEFAVNVQEFWVENADMKIQFKNPDSFYSYIAKVSEKQVAVTYAKQGKRAVSWYINGLPDETLIVSEYGEIQTVGWLKSNAETV